MGGTHISYRSIMSRLFVRSSLPFIEQVAQWPFRFHHAQFFSIRSESELRKRSSNIRWLHSQTVEASWQREEETKDNVREEEYGASLRGAEEKGSSQAIFASTGNRMILTDAMALLYRSHFAFASSHRLRTSAGEDTTVIFGFLATLLSLLELNPPPTHLAVVFDASGKTFRHELYSDYKAHRPDSPPEIGEALPKLNALLHALGIAVISLPGVEADDVIGTLAVRGVEAGMAVAIASPDKDFFQLLRPGLILLRPPPKPSPGAMGNKTYQRSSGYSKYALIPYTEEDFGREWGGLSPRQFVDALAMMGDASDNVPGITGIGRKTAITILQQSGTLEQAFSMALDGEISSKRAINLLTAPGMKEAAILSRALVEIRTGLDFPPAQVPLEDLRLKPPIDGGKTALKLLEEIEFTTHTSRFVALWKKNGWM